MVEVANPALDTFIAHIGPEGVFGQVVIQQHGQGWELCHVADTKNTALKVVLIDDLRGLAQFTTQGAFRPLKSAPNLQAGWRAIARNPLELEAALNHLYPGGIADWFAARQEQPPVTHYREFTGRQTGMYRITQMLNDEAAGRMISACCHSQFCLKRRFWTVQGLAPDKPSEKSAIACLEPCAILLEFARKAMRIEQAEMKNMTLSTEDLQTIREALTQALAHPVGNIREADFGAALNPRRIQLVLEKLGTTSETAEETEK
jgi:hypothetical protein